MVKTVRKYCKGQSISGGFQMALGLSMLCDVYIRELIGPVPFHCVNKSLVPIVLQIVVGK